MKTFNSLLSILLISLTAGNAQAAAPTIDTFNIQSYLKLSNNSPVSATSADFVFAVFKGTSCIWAKRYTAVAINSGVLNQKISGNGTNVTSINNASATVGECVSNFSGTPLDSTLLNTGSPAALAIRIYAETTIDTYKPIWDIPMNSAPTAFIADLANTATTATTANGLAASAKATTSAGAADNGKVPVLSGSGQIDSTMINAASLTIASTQITGLGTAATVNTGTTSGTIPLLGASGKLASAQMPTYSANKIISTDGAGSMVASYSGATVGGAPSANMIPVLNGSGLLPNSMIDPTVPADPAYLTSAVTVAKGGTGLASSGANLNILVSNGTTWTSAAPSASNIVDMTSTQAAIGGAKTFTGAVTHSSTSTLTGNVTMGGTLGVTGASTFTGAVTHSSTSTLTGNVTMGGTLAVTGASTLTGAVTATGATTFGTSMKVGTTNGTAYTQMKTCTIASAAMATGTSSVACAGVTTAAVMHCSPSVAPPAPSTGNAWVVIPYVSVAGTININVTQIGTPAAWTTAWNCVAMQ